MVETHLQEVMFFPDAEKIYQENLIAMSTGNKYKARLKVKVGAPFIRSRCICVFVLNRYMCIPIRKLMRMQRHA